VNANFRPLHGTWLVLAVAGASVSPVPGLRSHSFVLINDTTQYLINRESTEDHREEMASATGVILHSLRRR
jgi:hypothetical protein